MSTFDFIHDQLDIPFCTNGLPVGFSWKEKDEFIKWQFSWEQFNAAQCSVSGAKFGPTIKESVDWFIARSNQLDAEASSYLEEGYGYNLPMGYCKFGYVLTGFLDEDYEAIEQLCLWYQTTSGTILCHWADSAGKQGWEVYLPVERKGGNHHKELDYAKAGRTLEMINRWHNCWCRGDNDFTDYDEMARWFNANMVPLGYDEMILGPQLKREYEINTALKYVHGDYSTKYGIGRNVAELLGYWVTPKAKELPDDKETQRLAKEVYQELQSAVKKWEILCNHWEVDLNSESDDYSYEDDNYEFNPDDYS